MILDLLLDLSSFEGGREVADAVIRRLADADGLGAVTGRASCILPPGADAGDAAPLPNWHFETAAGAWALSNSAIEAAARNGRPLAVFLGPVLAGNEPIAMLLDTLEADPMFGFAAARVARENGELAKLGANLGDPEIESLPRAVLSALPEYYIVPEVAPACFVLRPEVVANLGELASNFRTAAGRWLHYLCRARRLGFRGAIVNRAVVSVAASAVTTFPIPEDYWELHRQYPDVECARHEFNTLGAHEYETLLARSFGNGRKSLLIDARGITPHHNGTALSILGLLDGFASAGAGWQISVLATPAASSFHELPKRYPYWTFFDRLPEKRFSIALRLSQPWDIDTANGLHSRALFNFYLMLDTISWDALCDGADPGATQAAWQFVADYADGILFISDFSRRRFAARFPSSGRTAHYVSYLSSHPADYGPPAPQPSTDDGYVLVVGNSLDHKWVAQAAELLATAFPFQSIRALGGESLGLPHVRFIPSGGLTQEEFGRLLGGARIVVFPSFYEGFGFPVVMGLSYGKPVVARRSALLEEIAARSRPGGRLYAFSDPLELVEIVARLLAGEDAAALPLGLALNDGEEPMRWPDAARNILGILERSLENPSGGQWMPRAKALLGRSR